MINAVFQMLSQLLRFLRSEEFQRSLPWLLPLLAVITLLGLSFFIARQLAHPSGWFGRTWMAGILNGGNKTLLDAALRCLDAKPGERIADIGFGGGYAIDKLLPLVKPERPIGVEVSEMMIDLGNEKWDDQVEVYLATVTSMPLSEASLDGVLSVNTIYFWSDPVFALQEIRRRLKPTGRLVLGIRNASVLRLSPVAWFRFRLYSQERLAEVLRKAGFDATFESVGGSGTIAIARPTPVSSPG